jgi:hypothetical protein
MDAKNIGFEVGVVVICSRGLIHSRTIESVEKNIHVVEDMKKQTWISVFTHERPIPDAQNWAISKALTYGPKWIWMVEEDIEVPFGHLDSMQDYMVKKKAFAVASSYSLKGGLKAHQVIDGEVVFVGLGCVLFDTWVFTQIKNPWFQTETYSINRDVVKKLRERAVYGGHDVNFWMKMKEHDLSWCLHPYEVTHLELVKHGADRVNHGYHTIRPIA